jgi:transposase-like protein
MPGNPKVKADLALLEDLDAELVLSMFEEGRSKADICRGLGIGRRALDRWIDENDYHSIITRARVEAASHLACETLAIADGMDVDNAQRDVQRIRTRQWLAERWDRKTYGTDKAQSVNISIQGLRMEALRHVEVVEELSTDRMQKISTEQVQLPND